MCLQLKRLNFIKIHPFRLPLIVCCFSLSISFLTQKHSLRLSFPINYIIKMVLSLCVFLFCFAFFAKPVTSSYLLGAYYLLLLN